MRVICNRAALADAVSLVGSVVAARAVRPALACLRLEAVKSAGGDYLAISGTDTEVSLHQVIRLVEVEQAGVALIPGDKLRDIVRASVDETVGIETTADQAVIKGSDSKFKVFVQDPANYPPVPVLEGDGDFSVIGGQFRQLVNKTLFAAAKESGRYAFSGVLVTAEEKTITLVSTDGRRLALTKGELSSGKAGKDGKKVIIPSKTLALVDKLIRDNEEPVKIKLEGNLVYLATADATLSSNLIEGQFPPYGDVIPKESDRRMEVSTAEFLSAVRRASLLTTEESRGVRMHFTAKKGVVITSSSPEAGESEVNLTAKFDGADLEIGFNPALLIEALKVVDSDQVVFEMQAANRPGVLKDSSGFVYVLMPVNLT